MKRRLLIIAIFLLAGAVVNVAVAWGCACWSAMEGPTRRGAVLQELEGLGVTWWRGFGAARCELDAFPLYREKSMRDIMIQAHRELSDALAGGYAAMTGAAPVCEYEYSPDLLPHWGRHSVKEIQSSAQDRNVVYADGRGWPMLSLWCRFDVAHQPDQSHAVISRRFALALWEGRGPWRIPFRDIRTIPYAPIWFGFALNSLFYAAILWLLIPGPFVLRRFLRRRRGLCPACGYDVKHAEHENCPECGRQQQGLQPGG